MSNGDGGLPRPYVVAPRGDGDWEVAIWKTGAGTMQVFDTKKEAKESAMGLARRQNRPGVVILTGGGGYSRFMENDRYFERSMRGSMGRRFEP